MPAETPELVMERALRRLSRDGSGVAAHALAEVARLRGRAQSVLPASKSELARLSVQAPHRLCGRGCTREIIVRECPQHGTLEPGLAINEAGDTE